MLLLDSRRASLQSPPRRKKEYRKTVRKNLTRGGVGEGGKRVTYGGLTASYFREMATPLIASCFGNREKPRPSEPHGSIYMMSLI